MKLRSGKAVRMNSGTPVTSRTCCLPFCDNNQQLINLCCLACETKKFCQKHYACMNCYIPILSHACTNRRVPVCPLDRSELVVSEAMKKLVETEVLMKEFWVNMERTAAEFTAIRMSTAEARANANQEIYETLRSPIGSRQRISRTVTRVRRLPVRQDAFHDIHSPISEAVTNVQEAMEPEPEPEPVQYVQDHLSDSEAQSTIDYGEADFVEIEDADNVARELFIFPEVNNENESENVAFINSILEEQTDTFSLI